MKYKFYLTVDLTEGMASIEERTEIGTNKCIEIDEYSERKDLEREALSVIDNFRAKIKKMAQYWNNPVDSSLVS